MSDETMQPEEDAIMGARPENVVDWDKRDPKIAPDQKPLISELFRGVVDTAWERGELDNAERAVLLELCMPALDALVAVYRNGRSIGYQRGRRDELASNWLVEHVRELLGEDSPV